MYSNLTSYQLKIDYYTHRMIYVSLTLTTKQKHTVNTQKKMRKVNITLKKVIKPQGREKEKKKGTERNCKNNQKTINKRAINIYLSIITLHVNALLSPFKNHSVSVAHPYVFFGEMFIQVLHPFFNWII